MSSPSADSSPATPGFAALALAPAIQRVLADVGYETPSPIQAAAIPPLLEGRDVLGQAQTGTGKTAAFALPILSRMDAAPGKPQALVLAPTRELAIQVAEAFQTYAAHIDGFRVLPIYGGQGYGPQLHGLRRGVHVVVGTPGRVIDHLRKGTLDLSALRFVVLDEADEMLRMGFAEDVDTILSAAPESRQTALFSATMPAPIRRIAHTHLKDPVEVSIAAKTATAAHIHQRYWAVSGVHKLDALTRILEAEPFDAMIVFARTRQSTETLAEKLGARGFGAAAIHGDIAQQQRERLIRQLRDGQLDILVATDVAARGLDVERISHVLNYDIPYDTESYVHRIGRTGRAGRSGEAILFVTPRERGMLRAIERATRQKVEPMQLPTVETVNDRRIERFIGRIDAALAGDDLTPFRQIIERYEHEHDTPAIEIAAALARLAHGDKPLLLKATDKKPAKDARHDPEPGEHAPRKPRATRPGKERPAPRRERPHQGEAGKDTYRLDVGHTHGAQPKHIIGAIANEADIDSRYIGRLTIRDDHSLIDLPEGMPRELLQHLRKVRVAGRPLRMRLDDSGDGSTPSHADRGPKRPSPRRGKNGNKRPAGHKPPRRH
ncbi:MAG TPA: DEAD/DEAH box helicase [Rhodanobacteraceae bacterium]|nr:DEAD/DEAH box helicase [Rhodanobacteraceae bacterium]